MRSVLFKTPVIFAAILSLQLLCGCDKGDISSKDGAQKLTIFTAASTNDCVSRISSEFTQSQDIKVEISAASSGTLAQQISMGAKTDIYISASRKWMKYLLDNNLADPEKTFSIASNRLVLICPDNFDTSGLDSENIAQKLPQLLGNKNFMSIGDPSHVPAGKYAKEALESLGIWQKLQGRLSYEANVTAVLQKAATGAAQFAIVYESDIISCDSVQKICRLDTKLHSPIEYYCSIISDSAAANNFVDQIFSAQGQRMFKICGFVAQEKTYAFNCPK